MRQEYKASIQALYAIVNDSPRDIAPTAHGFIKLCDAMRRASQIVDRVNLNHCNGIMRYDEKLRRAMPTLTESDMESLDKRRDRAVYKLRQAIGLYMPDLTYELSVQGDPRGLPFVIRVDNREYNF